MPSDRLYLTILKGRTPRSADPLIASEDQELIRFVARAIGARLGLRSDTVGVQDPVGFGQSKNGEQAG